MFPGPITKILKYSGFLLFLESPLACPRAPNKTLYIKLIFRVCKIDKPEPIMAYNPKRRRFIQVPNNMAAIIDLQIKTKE